MSPERGGQVAAALLLDAVLGEPPETVHPTVLMGLVISAFERRALRIESPRSRRLAGIVLAVSVPSMVFFSTRKILSVVPCKPRWMIGTALVSTTFSMSSRRAATSILLPYTTLVRSHARPTATRHVR